MLVVKWDRFASRYTCGEFACLCYVLVGVCCREFVCICRLWWARWRSTTSRSLIGVKWKWPASPSGSRITHLPRTENPSSAMQGKPCSTRTTIPGYGSLQRSSSVCSVKCFFFSMHGAFRPSDLKHQNEVQDAKAMLYVIGRENCLRFWHSVNEKTFWEIVASKSLFLWNCIRTSIRVEPAATRTLD